MLLDVVVPPTTIILTIPLLGIFVPGGNAVLRRSALFLVELASSLAWAWSLWLLLFLVVLVLLVLSWAMVFPPQSSRRTASSDISREVRACANSSAAVVENEMPSTTTDDCFVCLPNWVKLTAKTVVG